MSNGLVNSTTLVTLATWPPDYNPYLNVAGENAVLNALENEANSKRAPASYRQFLTTMHQTLLRLRTGISERDRKVSMFEADLGAMAEYLDNSRKNYDELYNILKDEHSQRKELERKVDALQKQVIQQQQQQLAPAPAPVPPSTPTPIPAPIPVPQSTLASSSVHPTSCTQPQQAQGHVPSPTLSAAVYSSRSPPMASVPLLTSPAPDATTDDAQKRLAERIKEYEKQLSRSAQGRRAMENQIIEQFNTINSQHARIKELEAEVVRLSNRYRQAHSDCEHLTRMVAPFLQQNAIIHDNTASSGITSSTQGQPVMYLSTNNSSVNSAAAHGVNLQNAALADYHHQQQHWDPSHATYDPSQQN